MSNLFKKLRRITNPCYYIFKTNNGASTCHLFMHKKLNRWELKHNKQQAPPITTVLHGKKLFLRFLKERGIYQWFIDIYNHNTQITKEEFNGLICRHFSVPFYFLLRNYKSRINSILGYNTDRDYIRQQYNDFKLMLKISKEWQDFLKSFNSRFADREIEVIYQD